MAPTDPREAYDDIVVERERRELDAEAFEAVRESEVFTTGWGVAALVFDDDGRVLCIDNEPYDADWVFPGGAVEPGESLPAAVRREVREETGVAVTVDRPLAVGESTVEHDGRVERMRFAQFLARANETETATGEELGEPDETIHEARWFADLPSGLYNPEHSRRCYERALSLR